MATYRAEAVVINQFDFEETSKILTLYAKYHGKVGAIAKGIRKVSSAKVGALEQFNHVRLSLSEGRNLDVVGEVEVIRSFHRLSESIPLVRAAYRMCELVDRLTPAHQKNPAVFQLLVAGLNRLTGNFDHPTSLGTCYQLYLLRLLGYWPQSGRITDPKLRQAVDRLLNTPLEVIDFKQIDRDLWPRLQVLVASYTSRVVDGGLKTDRVFLD